MKLAGCMLAGAACQGQTGTIDVTLTTAPGSTVLDAVETLELILTNPQQITTATRSGGGFSLELDLDATSDTGSLIVDGLDASGSLVATGQSPPFPLGALDASIAIYMAPPNSIGASPSTLSIARDRLAIGPLSYGAILAGGRDATGAASDALEIYNAFDHTIIAGLALLAPRAGLALGVGTTTFVYLFGGDDATGTATAGAWRFDTSIAPNGVYVDLGDKTGFERADQAALTLDDETFLVTGSPVGILSGNDGSMTARTEVASLPATGASVFGSDGTPVVITAGASGVTRFRDDMFDTLAVPAAARDGSTVIAMISGKVGVVCGGADTIRIDAAAGTAETFPMLPSELRTGCAAASTASYVVIAGGTLASGDVATTAEIYDATTLALITTQPLVVPRTGASATALPNGQVLIAGGVDATGAPTATLELFTPAPPE